MASIFLRNWRMKRMSWLPFLRESSYCRARSVDACSICMHDDHDSGSMSVRERPAAPIAAESSLGSRWGMAAVSAIHR